MGSGRRVSAGVGWGVLPWISVCRACVEHHERPLRAVGVEAGGQEEEQRAAESLWAELMDTGPGAQRAGERAQGEEGGIVAESRW